MFKSGEWKLLGKLSLKSLLIACALMAVVATTAVCLFGFAMTKHVVIHDGEETVEVTTMKGLVSEVLEEHSISYREEDRITPAPDQQVKNKDIITIERARRVVVAADGVEQEYYSCEPTVAGVLEEKGVIMGEYDEITPSLETEVTPDLVIQIDRVEVRLLDFEVEIPFQTKRTPVSDKPKGYTKVLQEGKNGLMKQTYRNVYRNGEEISSEVVAEEVLAEAVAQQMEYGTYEERVVVTSRGNLSYSRVLTCTATAYDASPASNGIYAGKTATGRKPTYGVVAVDPRVIPLNSRLYIESSDGGQSWVYGYAVAGDTGGAIKGNKVDLCFDSRSEVIQFGRRSATVYILN